jgi:hypothetical protein
MLALIRRRLAPPLALQAREVRRLQRAQRVQLFKGRLERLVRCAKLRE